MSLALVAVLASTLTAPVLYGPSADLGPAVDGEEQLRVRMGIFTGYGSLAGRVEKEDAKVGPGSGGDRVSLRGDLDLPEFSWSWRTEVALEPSPYFRIRIGAQYMGTKGRNTLSQGFRHDGHQFLPGARVESELRGALLDAELHFLPRQARRVRSEFGLFTGVRFAAYEHEVDQPGVQTVRDRTTALWPRFGVQGYGEMGSGVMIWGESAVGGWWSGDTHDSYAAASFDFKVGIGWVFQRMVDVRVGYHFQTFGIWRERSDDMERLTMERNFFVFGALFRTP